MRTASWLADVSPPSVPWTSSFAEGKPARPVVTHASAEITCIVFVWRFGCKGEQRLTAATHAPEQNLQHGPESILSRID